MTATPPSAFVVSIPDPPLDPDSVSSNGTKKTHHSNRGTRFKNEKTGGTPDVKKGATTATVYPPVLFPGSPSLGASTSQWFDNPSVFDKNPFHPTEAQRAQAAAVDAPPPMEAGKPVGGYDTEALSTRVDEFDSSTGKTWEYLTRYVLGQQQSGYHSIRLHKILRHHCHPLMPKGAPANKIGQRVAEHRRGLEASMEFYNVKEMKVYSHIPFFRKKKKRIRGKH